MSLVYIVGPLFTEADQKQRKLEGEILRGFLSTTKNEFTLINPIDLPLNEGNQPSSPTQIFLADYHYQCEAKFVFFELSSNDTGSMMALGILLEKKMAGNPVTLYPIYSDSRIQRNQANGVECPVGFNSFVVGGIQANQIPIYSSFEEAFDQFQLDFIK